MTKKALVTGGGGFIGFHLADYLSMQKDTEVTVIDNLSRGQMDGMLKALVERPNVKFIQADMTKVGFFDMLEPYYDNIYHLAAINGTRYFYEKAYEVLRVNILSLMNLLAWINKKNCGKLLFTSSSEAYAGTINRFGEKYDFLPTDEDIPLTIDDVYNARFSYGGSKITGELLTINYCRTNDVPFSIVRYHNIYGPRMGYEHVIPEFCKRIFDRENPFSIYGGEETRAFCYVTDAVKATESVMLSDSCDQKTIHIGNSSEEIKIKELAEMLFCLSGIAPDFDIKPAPKGCVKRRCPDTSKLLALTGYSAKTTLAVGLKETYEWYISQFKSS